MPEGNNGTSGGAMVPSFNASTELSKMTSDQLVSVRQPDNTDLSCRGMHRSTPLLNGLGQNDTGRSQPKP